MTTIVERIQEPLVRQLSVRGLWLLIINGMIGAGIFGVPAEAARLAGAFSPWVFVICAVLMFPIMLCFAQLGSYFSGTGGPVVYAGTAFGPMIGFQAGWAMYIGRITGFAANLNLLVNALAYFTESAESPAARNALMFIVCSMMTLVNVIGARDAVRSLGVLTVLKFLPLVAMVAFGLVQLDFASLVPAGETPPALGDIGAAVLIVIYAYVGFESGLVVAGEARNPQHDMPRALLLALAVCSALYALIQAVSVAALPSIATTARPLVDVAGRLMGPAGALLLMSGVIASVGGNLIGAMFSAPRITYRLALEGHLPQWMGAVHPAFKTPIWSIAFFGTACFLLAVTGSFAWLAALSVLTRVLVYLCCIGALPRARNRFNTASEALHLPGGYTVPVLAVLVCLGLLTQVKGSAYLVAAGFLGVGSILYFTARSSLRIR